MKTIASPHARLMASATLTLLSMTFAPAFGQIGHRSPSEKKTVTDPVTGVPLTFLTINSFNDSKIYQTHPQWTADGKWLIFRSNRAEGQAFAVNEQSGDIVQVTNNAYTGMLCVAQKSMRIILMREVKSSKVQVVEASTNTIKPNLPAYEIVAVDLNRLFADSEACKMHSSTEYEKVLGTIPVGVAASYELALDADEETVYYRLTREEAGKHLAPGTKIETGFGAYNMGVGPGGIGSMNLTTGETGVVATLPFLVGHIQTNPWVSGEIVFAWETRGKSPQRTWTVKADGTGLRPLYPEAPYDWVTHEAIITQDEVVFALMGHRKIGTNDAWGPAGTKEHPTGLAVVNLRTKESYIAGQTRSGSGLWHVHGSPDGRFLVGDDFDRNIWIINRQTSEMRLLSTGHKDSAADHPHPSFSPDSTRIEIQSAMLSEDGKAMNICIIPVPQEWLKPQKTP